MTKPAGGGEDVTDRTEFLTRIGSAVARAMLSRVSIAGPIASAGISVRESDYAALGALVAGALLGIGLTITDETSGAKLRKAETVKA